MFSFWKHSKIKTHTIRAKNPYDFGYALGECTRAKIKTLATFVESSAEFQSLQQEKVINKNLNFLFAKYPELFEELCGLAKGAGANLQAVAALNFFEDFILKGAEHCSLLVSSNHMGLLLGWNEDAQSRYNGQMSLITGYLAEQSFVSLNYPGLLCGDTLAINSHGLVLAIQGLKPVLNEGAGRIGLPWGLAGRLFLLANDINEVLELAKKLSQDQNLLHGFHLFCYDIRRVKAISIEFHPQLNSPRYITMGQPFFLAHTNHYQLIKEDGDQIRQNITASSRDRLAYLELYKKMFLSSELLANILSNRHPQEVFSQGENICREGKICTLHSQVLAVPFMGCPILWTSPGIPSQYQFKDWDVRKVFLS